MKRHVIMYVIEIIWELRGQGWQKRGLRAARSYLQIIIFFVAYQKLDHHLPCSPEKLLDA